MLHAVLALGSAHKRDSLEGTCEGPPNVAPDDEERFILRHYRRSIRQLQPHFKSKKKESVRIALIACMLFVCLEFIRGRYQTGNEHLVNGMRLVCDLGGLNEDGSVKAIDLRYLEPQDLWLMETFAKLNLQANFLGQGDRSVVPVVQNAELGHFPVIFADMQQARKRLDWQQYKLGQIKSEWEGRDILSTPVPTKQLLNRQRKVLEALQTWERVYTVSRAKLLGSMGQVGPCGYLMLKLYHKMALVMAYTCFKEQGESSFDAHTSIFLFLISDSIDLCREVLDLKATEYFEDSPYVHRPDCSPFTSDKGWIPPLYFTAVHCRVHRIRSQAIRLLRTTLSKEGVWDSELAAAVASELMRMEEQDANMSTSFDDSFTWDDKPMMDRLDPIMIPEHQRMVDVQVTLPNGPQEAMAITCRRSVQGAETIARIYDPATKTWD